MKAWLVPCCIHITQCVCSLTCKYLEQFVLPHFKSPSTHRIFNNDPLLINNIIQVITLWEPASNHFLCNYCIFNILVHSNTCICLLNAFLINREIKTNVTNALRRVLWHLRVVYRFNPLRKELKQTDPSTVSMVTWQKGPPPFRVRQASPSSYFPIKESFLETAVGFLPLPRDGCATLVPAYVSNMWLSSNLSKVDGLLSHRSVKPLSAW